MATMLSRAQRDIVRQRLARTVCSSAWLEAMVADDGLPRTNVFPPGGRAGTQMRICGQCQRITPPNDGLPFCCDCQVEAEEARFVERYRRAHPRVKPGLLRRWWAEGLRFFPGAGNESGPDSQRRRLRDEIDRQWNACGARKFLPGDEEQAETGGLALPHETLANVCWVLGLPAGGVRFRDPIPRSSLSGLPRRVAWALARVAAALDNCVAPSVRSATTALRAVVRTLGEARIVRRRGTIVLVTPSGAHVLIRYAPAFPTRRVEIGSGKSSGCHLTLLPESDSALRREIAFAEQHGRVVPSARRFSRSSPRLPAPEDRLPLQACLGPKRRAARRRP